MTHVLQGNPEKTVGVSIVMVTSVARVPDLQTTTQALLASMAHFSPQISQDNTTVSWFQVDFLHAYPCPLPCLNDHPVALASLSFQLQ